MRIVPERDTLPRLLAFVYAPVLLCMGILLNTGAVRTAALPACALLNATGVACPTCGGTRAGLALWRLDPVEAFVQNPLVAAGLIALAAWFAAAAVMTLVPALRHTLQLETHEWRRLRRIALCVFVCTWIYEIVRHLGAD